MRLESPPPLCQRLEQRLLAPPQLDQTRECLDDCWSMLTKLWRPRDRKSSAAGTCEGAGRHGKGKGEEWRLEAVDEAGSVGVDPGASHETLEAADELLDDVEGDQGLEVPRLEGPRRRQRR